MEDTRRPEAQPSAIQQDKTRIIELTPEMVVPEESAGRIIDLSQVLSQPEFDAVPAAPPRPEGIPTPGVPETPPRRTLFEALTAGGREKTATPLESTVTVKDSEIDTFSSVADRPHAAPEDGDGSAGIAPDAFTADEEDRSTGGESLRATDLDEPAEPASPQEATAVEALLDADDAIELIEVAELQDPSDTTTEAAGESVFADEEIIELTEAVAANDEAIELTEAVPASNEILELTDSVETAEAEDEIIELTDMISPEEPAVEPPSAVDDDEEIIELTDIVSLEEQAAEPPSAVDDDEVIIELTDIVSPEELAAVQGTAVNLAEVEEAAAPAPDEERVIRLDEILNRMRADKPRLTEQISRDIEVELTRQGLPTEAEGAAAETADEEPGAGASETPLPVVAPETVKQAVEQVIRTQYGHIIEKMIATVVEEVVTREMEIIKQGLAHDGELEG